MVVKLKILMVVHMMPRFYGFPALSAFTLLLLAHPMPLFSTLVLCAKCTFLSPQAKRQEDAAEMPGEHEPVKFALAPVFGDGHSL